MHRPAVLIVLSLALSALIAGCDAHGPSRSPAATPTGLPGLEDCVLPSYHAREVVFRTGRDELFGAEFGSGTVGIVMAHEYRSDLCGWVPYAVHLSTLGYRALAFDFGDDLAGDVAAAAAQLRHDGVRTIILMGASMGASASLVVASRAPPAVVAVASLSGPAEYSGLDALGAARHLTVPVLFMDSLSDAGFTADARSMYAACPSRRRQLLLFPGNDHGTQLLEFTVEVQAFAALDRFVQSVASSGSPPT
jgi:hypothetical protein